MVLSAEWEALNTPHLGTGTDMSIGWDIGPPGQWVIYTADELNMMYKSTNNGEHWDSLYQDPYACNPICVITDPGDADVVYLGKSDGANPDPPPYDVIFKSTDGGQSWDRVSDENVKSKIAICFAMHPDYPNTVYAGFNLNFFNVGDQGIYKTTNGGDTWNQGGAICHTVRDIWIHPNDPDILYAASDSSVRKSTDGGTSWSPGLGSNLYIIHNALIRVSISPGLGSNLYIIHNALIRVSISVKRSRTSVFSVIFAFRRRRSWCTDT
jgi:photosystem II stability/assembly factor-like uncharacterized protein